jgi:hypothetical protein
LKYIVVLTVIYEDYTVFFHNYESIVSQNKEIELRFVVVDNSKYPNSLYVDKLRDKKNIHYLRNHIVPKLKLKSNSFHHSLGLDLGISFIQKSYQEVHSMIVIDPDYFVFGDNWISCLTNFMFENNYMIAGSPWAKRWTHKYKNFPCVQCMIIVGDLIPKLPSFAPINSKNYLLYHFWNLVYSNRYIQYLSKFFVNHVFDTGSQIFYNYRNKHNFVFTEITLSELYQSDFFLNYSNFKFILNAIEDVPGHLEVFRFNHFFTVHFRTFGNSILSKSYS